MPKIEVRRASENEFSVCRRFDKFNADEVLQEKISREFVYLAFVDNECVGYLRWDYFWNRLPYLCLIVVDKKIRAQGVGRSLLEAWTERLKVSGFDFCLSSSQENEPPAVNWHLKQGFKEIGRIATLNDDGSTEIFLRKDFT